MHRCFCSGGRNVELYMKDAVNIVTFERSLLTYRDGFFGNIFGIMRIRPPGVKKLWGRAGSDGLCLYEVVDLFLLNYRKKLPGRYGF
ncbi:hypothetical protein RB195_003679 [Necator americanus]|uniref:Uncharacterized protein n=1 Tax=Necator americanus TaxID=51031 RepID=A0ABR1DPN6_NECAM